MLPSKLCLLRLLTTLSPQRNHLATLSGSEQKTTPEEPQRSSSIEHYVTQLADSSWTAISAPIPATQSTRRQTQKVINIPASAGWAMRTHPELYDPPVLKPTHRMHVATLVIEACNPEKDQLPLVAGFALEATSHLGIPVTRPASIPIQTELHTVLRSGFVHKKLRENFRRLTHRRVIKAYRLLKAIQPHVQTVVSAQKKAEEQMSKMLQQGLVQLDQSMLLSAFQTAYNLSILNQSVGSLIFKLTHLLTLPPQMKP
ncbi:hypothetical protein PCANC_14369 [Puccinia coronata f. sp. avenae]|uniref:Small ribosomal subunit protein uS10 domain-containing protein n=1 Tax=Puccinia coronata f. sp. avenae TaxID=200324 RepID=A0A2N5V9G7_9BASI|nr:hypothetical protein PCANC_14369 [Puccinia coronata f. sp. avenae]